MTKKKKAGEKMNSQSKRRRSGKKGKKDQDNPVTQAKMFCTEAASHEKGGNYNRALHCYNLKKTLEKRHKKLLGKTKETNRGLNSTRSKKNEKNRRAA